MKECKNFKSTWLFLHGTEDITINETKKIKENESERKGYEA